MTPEIPGAPTPRPAPRLNPAPAESARVVLIGPPAAGKSTIGRILAERLHMPILDTDQMIVDRYGPIPDIFRDRGEAAFREIERDAVRRALRKLLDRPGVVSLGGGAVLNQGTRAQLRHPALTVVLIMIDEQTVAQRLGNPSRPLLAGDPEAAVARWRALVEERRPLYEQVADVTVHGSDSSPVTAVNRIVDRLSKDARAHEYAKYRYEGNEEP